MDEKETLIRVEQQMQDSIKNQSLILNDLKEIFNKIESESKATAIVKSDLNTHLETTVVRREDNERRFKALEEHQKNFIQLINDLQNDLPLEFSSFKESLINNSKIENENLKKLIAEEQSKRTDQFNEYRIFQKQITTSIAMLKWMVGFLVVAIGALWPVFTFIFTKNP